MQYYPTLNEFWPAVRARSFVKALGEKPGNYAHNMEILAKRAGVHAKQMHMVNPLTFGERNGIVSSLRTLLGRDTYSRFEVERLCEGTGSSTWAYHKKEPIPSYSEWTENITVIQKFLEDVNATSHAAARLPIVRRLYSYILKITPFLVAHQNFLATFIKKTAEFKEDPAAAPILDILLKAEAFLASLPVPANDFQLGACVQLSATGREKVAKAPREKEALGPGGVVGRIYDIYLCRVNGKDAYTYSVARYGIHTDYYIEDLEVAAEEPTFALFTEICRKAQSGDHDAQFHLGCYYENGHCVEKNLTTAMAWYSRAAEGGCVEARYILTEA